MERYDYCTNDLLGAARYAAIYFNGYDVPDEPSVIEAEQDELFAAPGPALSDGDRQEISAAFEEVYGRSTAVADLPF